MVKHSSGHTFLIRSPACYMAAFLLQTERSNGRSPAWWDRLISKDKAKHCATSRCTTLSIPEVTDKEKHGVYQLTSIATLWVSICLHTTNPLPLAQGRRQGGNLSQVLLLWHLPDPREHLGG